MAEEKPDETGPAEDAALATISETASFDDGIDADDAPIPPSPIPGAKTP